MEDDNFYVVLCMVCLCVCVCVAIENLITFVQYRFFYIVCGDIGKCPLIQKNPNKLKLIWFFFCSFARIFVLLSRIACATQGYVISIFKCIRIYLSGVKRSKFKVDDGDDVNPRFSWWAHVFHGFISGSSCWLISF